MYALQLVWTLSVAFQPKCTSGVPGRNRLPRGVVEAKSGVQIMGKNRSRQKVMQDSILSLSSLKFSVPAHEKTSILGRISSLSTTLSSGLDTLEAFYLLKIGSLSGKMWKNVQLMSKKKWTSRKRRFEWQAKCPTLVPFNLCLRSVRFITEHIWIHCSGIKPRRSNLMEVGTRPLLGRCSQSRPRQNKYNLYVKRLRIKFYTV